MAHPNNSREHIFGLKDYADGLLRRVAELPWHGHLHRGFRESSIVDAIQDVDDVLALSRHRLREYRNSLVPVNLLPPEILSAILVFHALGCSIPVTETSASPMSISTPAVQRRSLTLSHVCRHWRDIALKTTPLWRRTLLSMRPGADGIWLQRSLSAPLNVEISSRGRSASDLWDRVSPHLDRIRTLKINHGTLRTSLASLRRFTTPAPMLESLQLTITEYSRIHSIPLLKLPTLFGGRMPRLKHLDLGYYTILSDNHFENLTYLRFHNQTYRTVAEIEGMFSVLEASPHLEQLSFRRCYFLPPEATEANENPVWFTSSADRPPLRHLRHLDIDQCDIGFVCYTTNQLKVPHDNIVITANYYVGGGHLLSNLTTISNSDANTHSVSLPFITSLSLAFDGDIVRLAATGPATVLWVYFKDRCTDRGYRDTHDVCRDLPRTLTLSALTELKIGGRDKQSDEAWLDIFQQLSSLKRLILVIAHGDNYRPHKWLLKLITSWNSRPGELPCPAPQLSELCIAFYVPHLLVWNLFVDVMQKRAELGYPLDTIRIMLCAPANVAAEYRATFEEWKLKQPELEACAEKVVFEEGKGYLIQGVSEGNMPYMTETQLAEWHPDSYGSRCNGP
ncbi:hypothetical protein BDY19DRAFT_101654 [Irpex rosettiformis]|uniref:Uncharacterized protein n=1 Tax=Irpex rosettiformis TaxID=378272 RepID=A0ACB8U603_9APHY|nr:hypothetical protein BDY19DRAFT_101654 [Irpex rosettiformis]